MKELYQSLEKIVRDIEKGALRVDGKTMIDSKVYDVRCYRVIGAGPRKSRLVRIDLMEGKGYDES